VGNRAAAHNLPMADTPAVHHVDCPECGGNHSFVDVGVDLYAERLLARSLCVDLHRRMRMIEEGASLAQVLGLE